MIGGVHTSSGPIQDALGVLKLADRNKLEGYQNSPQNPLSWYQTWGNAYAAIYEAACI
jgi:hypothetical protein